MDWLTDRPATRLLCGTLVAVFALQLAFDATAGIGLARMGATTPWTLQESQLWTVLSSTLLHIGLLHLLANLYFTWMIGGVLEQGIGGARMLIVFFVSGVVGSTATVLFLGDAVSAGASGGAWGLMLAILMLLTVPWTRRGTRIRGGPVRPILTMIGLNAVISFLPGINGLAHFGGGLGGALTLLVLQAVRMPWWPVAALLYALHLGAIGYAIVDGHPWDPFPQRPIVTTTVGDSLFTAPLPEGTRVDRQGTTVTVRTPDLEGFGATLELIEGPVRLDQVYAELLDQAGGEPTTLPCAAHCRAARIDLPRLTFWVSIRSYGQTTLLTLLTDLSGTNAWMEDAVVATRLGPDGLRRAVAALDAEAAVAREALVQDHPAAAAWVTPPRP
jgi:rhomboid protease GluP